MSVRLQMKQFEKETKRKRQAESPESGINSHSQKTGLTGTDKLDLTDNCTRTGAGKMSQLLQEESPSRSFDKLTTPKAHALEMLATVATSSHTSSSSTSASSKSESVITLGFKPRGTDSTFASYCTHKMVPSTKWSSASRANSEHAKAGVEVVDLISNSGSELSTQTLEDEVSQGEVSEKDGNEEEVEEEEVVNLGSSSEEVGENEGSPANTPLNLPIEAVERLDNVINTTTSATAHKTSTHNTTIAAGGEEDLGEVVVEVFDDAEIARYVNNLPRSSTADASTSSSGNGGNGGNSGSRSSNATATTAAMANNNPSMTASTTNTTSNTTPTTSTSNTTHTGDAERKRTTDIAHLERILANKEVRDQLTMQQQDLLKERLVELLLRNA